MTPAPSRGELVAARFAWTAVAVLVVAVYVAVVAPAEAAIDREQRAARAFYERAESDEQLVRNAAALTVVRDRVRADLARLRGQQSRSAAIAAFLRLADRERQAFHVEVPAIEPVTAAAGTVRAAAPGDPLTAQDLTFGIRGRYRDVIAVVADLSRHDVLLDVHDVELASRARDDASLPAIDATLHATLYRLELAAMQEVPSHARSIR